MQKLRTPLLTVLALAGLVFLFWRKTMAAQQASCEVCVTFNGQRQCARATGASSAEAARTAQSTACGPVSNGMNEKIACDRRPPDTRRCDPPLP